MTYFLLVVVVSVYYFVVAVRFLDSDYENKSQFYVDLIPFSFWIKSFLEKFNSLK